MDGVEDKMLELMMLVMMMIIWERERKAIYILY
jgi:hypothetical protein